MAAAPKKIIPSVDYTSRDYAALRQELITRVQDRVPAWTGNDPADFWLALVGLLWVGETKRKIDHPFSHQSSFGC